MTARRSSRQALVVVSRPERSQTVVPLTVKVTGINVRLREMRTP
jgi:hypothetical protein